MPRPLREFDVVRFGECELRIATQELLCRGQPCEIEPRVLAVLVYLIENSDRVISKDELLENIWKTIHLTEGVAARAVMKLRRAIEDTDIPSRYLRTVHRVGYRFMGEWTIEAAPPPRDLLDRVMDLALLPFRNEVLAAHFEWVELGLMSIMHRDLTAAGVRVTPIPDVLVATGDLAASSLDECAATVEAALGVNAVLAVVVTRTNDLFALEWRILPLAEPAAEGRIESPDLVGATRELASRVAELVMRAGGAPLPAAFDLQDPFLNEAYGRGLQAYHSGRLREAAALLRLCRDRAEQSRVDVDLFMVEADSYDEAALAHGEEILAREAGGSVALRAAVLERLAQVCQFLELLGRAEDHCKRCAALLATRQLPEIEARLMATRAALAWRRSDYALARQLASAVLHGAQRSGNALEEAQALRQLGLIETGAGQPEAALPVLLRSAALCARHGFATPRTMALASICEVHTLMGRVGAASQLLERARLQAEGRSTPHILVRLATLRFALALLRGEAAAARAALDSFELAAAAGLQRLALIVTCCRGLLALLTGDIDAASRLLDEVLRLMPDTRVAAQLLAVFIAPQLRRKALDSCERTLQLFEERRHGVADPLLASLAHGCRAQLAHAAGDTRGARAENGRSLALAPVTSAAVLIGTAPFALDAIWLAAEDDEPDAVAALVGAMESWLCESARGVATLARYNYAIGRFTEALALQRRYRSMIGSETHDFCADLLQCYEGAARRGRRRALPRVRSLPASP